MRDVMASLLCTFRDSVEKDHNAQQVFDSFLPFLRLMGSTMELNPLDMMKYAIHGYLMRQTKKMNFQSTDQSMGVFNQEISGYDCSLPLNSGYLDELPDECLSHIMKWLDLPNRQSTELVCTRMLKISRKLHIYTDYVNGHEFDLLRKYKCKVVRLNEYSDYFVNQVLRPSSDTLRTIIVHKRSEYSHNYVSPKIQFDYLKKIEFDNCKITPILRFWDLVKYHSSTLRKIKVKWNGHPIVRSFEVSRLAKCLIEAPHIRILRLDFGHRDCSLAGDPLNIHGDGQIPKLTHLKRLVFDRCNDLSESFYNCFCQPGLKSLCMSDCTLLGGGVACHSRAIEMEDSTSHSSQSTTLISSLSSSPGVDRRSGWIWTVPETVEDLTLSSVTLSMKIPQMMRSIPRSQPLRTVNLSMHSIHEVVYVLQNCLCSNNGKPKEYSFICRNILDPRKRNESEDVFFDLTRNLGMLVSNHELSTVFFDLTQVHTFPLWFAEEMSVFFRWMVNCSLILLNRCRLKAKVWASNLSESKLSLIIGKKQMDSLRNKRMIEYV